MIIHNGCIITFDRQNSILTGFGLRIADGKISKIEKTQKLFEMYPDEEKVDAEGQLILPGFICAHTHFYGAYARGMYVPGEPAKSFPEILENLWWPLDKALDEPSIRSSAAVCLIDAIRHGTTMLFDHHASPIAIRGSLATIADQVIQSGLRASLCYEVTDRDGEQKALEGIEENLDYINWVLKISSEAEYLKAKFGLHASLTLTDKTLEKCRQSCPENVGFHIHVAEHKVDQEDSLKKYGKRVLSRLNDHGILGENTLLIHAVHINQEEMELIKKSGSFVSHQPRSNMNNGVGLPDIKLMMALGIPVCLGNDGFSNNMVEEWTSAYLSHKLESRDPRVASGYQVQEIGILNNRKLANKEFIGGSFGVIEENASADLTLLRYNPYTPVTSENLPWHMVFGFSGGQFTSTMVNGKFLMRDNEIITMDEEKVFCEAYHLAPQVWQRYQQRWKERIKYE